MSNFGQMQHQMRQQQQRMHQQQQQMQQQMQEAQRRQAAGQWYYNQQAKANGRKTDWSILSTGTQIVQGVMLTIVLVFLGLVAVAMLAGPPAS